MKKGAEYLLILLGFTLNLTSAALANVGLEINRDFSKASLSNNASINYFVDSFKNKDTGIIGISHNVQYAHSNSLTTLNLNSNVSDFDILATTHALGYDATIYEKITIALKYRTTNFNENEVLQSSSSGGIYYELGMFQLGYTVSSGKTYQNNDVIILAQNYKDDITFKENSSSYFLGIRWSDRLRTSLNYTSFTYSKNLNVAFAILTTVPFLLKAGGVVASEIRGRLKNSTDLATSYLMNENWLLTLGIGSAVDYLDPSSKTNNVNLGVEYEIENNEIYYRLFALADFSKSPDASSTMAGTTTTNDMDETSTSGQIGVGISF